MSPLYNKRMDVQSVYIYHALDPDLFVSWYVCVMAFGGRQGLDLFQ